MEQETAWVLTFSIIAILFMFSLTYAAGVLDSNTTACEDLCCSAGSLGNVQSEALKLSHYEEFNKCKLECLEVLERDDE